MPFSVACGACGASFKLSQEIYERRIKGRKVALRCKKCQAEIPVDGTKLDDGTMVVASAEPGGPPLPVDPNVSFVPQPEQKSQLVVPETSIKEQPQLTAKLESLPRDTSWFPSGTASLVPPVVPPVMAAPPEASPAAAAPAVLPEPPASERPSREPMDTPRVPIAVGREAMPTPRELDASVLASSAAQAAEFTAPEPPTKPGTVAVTALADGHTPRTPEAAAFAAETAAARNEASATTPSAPNAGATATDSTPRAAEAGAPVPRVVPRPKLDSKMEQPSRPKAGSPLEPQRPKQEFKKPEIPSRPKQETLKAEPSRPKHEFVKPELPSRPKQEFKKPEIPSRPKQETSKAEPSRSKQEFKKPEQPSRPKQESRPDLEARAGPPPRPKQESRPNFAAEPPIRPRQESRPRLESEPRLAPSPEEEARARAVATEAVARALASTESKAQTPEPAAVPIAAPPAHRTGAAAVSAVPAVPEPRPISLPPARPSLPPGRRWAFIGGIAGVLVVSLVVLGWLLSTVSSQSDVAVPSARGGVASAAPPTSPTAEEEEEEEEPAANAGRGTPPNARSTGASPVPAGSAPGLLEQAVANLNSQADDSSGDGKSFDREAALKALDIAANRASRCRSKGDPSGNVTVLVIFNPSGTVKEARVVDTRYDGRPTARCIASRMAQTRIRPFEGSPKTLAKSVLIP